MKKDIFIDTNIAKNFANPLDPEYKKLLDWLQNNDVDETKKSYLVVSNKLLAEYNRSALHPKSATSIPALVDILTRQGRLVKITKDDIEEFKRKHFTKALIKKMQSNTEDREHIPVVFLSNRRYALTFDDGFTHDLQNFPRFTATDAKRPQDLPYRA